MKSICTVYLFELSFAYTGAHADANLLQLVGVRRIYSTIYNGTCVARPTYKAFSGVNEIYDLPRLLLNDGNLF